MRELEHIYRIYLVLKPYSGRGDVETLEAARRLAKILRDGVLLKDRGESFKPNYFSKSVDRAMKNDPFMILANEAGNCGFNEGLLDRNVEEAHRLMQA